MIKRLLVGVVAAATVASVTGTVASAAGTEKGEYDTAWTVMSATCDQIPPGTILTGIGHGHFTNNPRTNGTFSGMAHATGTAVDQLGNVYHWSYTNNAVGTIDEAGVVTARMVDSFVVAGPGPSAYETGFKATFVEVPGVSFEITPTWVRGDPFDFDNPAGRCDPI